MTPILVSFLVQDPYVDPHGFCIHTDGQVESYRTSHHVQDANGSYVQEGIAPDWYPLMKLAPAALARIQEAIDALQPIPDTIPAEEQGRASVTWQIGDHTLTFQWQPLPPAARPYMALSHLIGDEVLQSMD